MSISGNRFERNNRIKLNKFPAFLSIAAFIVLFWLFYSGIGSVSQTNIDKQLESLETALSRSITQCYAVEGAYPPSLSYIKEHYGLTYDENLFYIDYQPIGSNIIPDVTILKRAGGTE